MDESKHTPGPWRISRTSGMGIFINHDHDHPDRVAGYFAEVRRFTSNNEQVEANAKLIAAAPDMLEALQGLLAIIDESRGVDGYHLNGDIAEWDYFADDINAAVAAIKKARGDV